MLSGPFLTDLDPQAAVKGSRDPLGLQTIWVRLGRRVVGNLTTVSTSVRDFTTLVLGYYFAERVSNEQQGDGNLAVFLRWEQLGRKLVPGRPLAGRSRGTDVLVRIF